MTIIKKFLRKSGSLDQNSNLKPLANCASLCEWSYQGHLLREQLRSFHLNAQMSEGPPPPDVYKFHSPYKDQKMANLLII